MIKLSIGSENCALLLCVCVGFSHIRPSLKLANITFDGLHNDIIYCDRCDVAGNNAS